MGKTTTAAITSAPAAVAIAAPAPLGVPAPSAAPNPERFELERTLLADTNPHQRRGAVDRLAALPDSDDALIRTLISDPDPLVRRWSALALERRQANPTVESGVRQALIAERDSAVRSVLERTLASIEAQPFARR